MMSPLTFGRCVALFAVILPAPLVAHAQSLLTQRDLEQVVQQALRTALTAAKIGSRNVPSDSAVIFDTTSLALVSTDGERRFDVVSLARLHAGRRLVPTTREMAFSCPAKDIAPRISADCTLRSTRTYVRVGLLDIVDATTATLWVSIIAPGKNPSERAERFRDFTVKILVKKGPEGWTIGIPTTRVAG